MRKVLIELELSYHTKKHYFKHLFSKLYNIRTNSGDGLPLEKISNMQSVVILIKSIFNNNHNHCCYEMLFKRCSYKYIKCYIMIELMFLKTLLLIKQVYLKNILFVTNDIF